MSFKTLGNMRDRRDTSLSISSTSSSDERFHDESLPLSPTLPSPVTKYHKKHPPRGLSTALNIVATLASLALVYHYVFCGHLPFLWRVGTPPPPAREADPNLVGDAMLPDFPTPVIVTDRHGQSRWTVSIPPQHSFPLHAAAYHDICSDSESISNSVSGPRRANGWRRKASYNSEDAGFLDVAEAQKIGALPRSAEASIPVVGQRQEGISTDGSVCQKSLTFAMDTEDAGFGKTMMLLWLSYGLAKKEGRAFFVDDTRWPYGKYTSYFKPPPAQNCMPPPVSQVIPCPHSAKHLLVSAATLPWTFGPSFSAQYRQSRNAGMAKQRQIFDMIRHGYSDLFLLNDDDASYAKERATGLRNEVGSTSGAVIGMHMRRGDLHPLEYQFSNDYLPLDRYARAAHQLLYSHVKHRLSSAAHPSTSQLSHLDDFAVVSGSIHSPIVLASDDPDIFTSPELGLAAAPFNITPAQARIQLASKAILDRTSPAEPIREPGSAYVKHVDENAGWDGGFYSGLFFALGRSKLGPGSGGSEKLYNSARHLEKTGQDGDDIVPEQAMRMRELIGRAYLLDLAVLGESDGVVCAVSSEACRILGVMMGWDAVDDGRWKNVDDGRRWSWNGQM